MLGGAHQVNWRTRGGSADGSDCVHWLLRQDDGIATPIGLSEYRKSLSNQDLEGEGSSVDREREENAKAKVEGLVA